MANWFLLQTKTNFEKLCSRELLDRVVEAVDVYVPVIRSRKKHRRYAGVVVVSDRPAFPGYIFVATAAPIVDWVKAKRRVPGLIGPVRVEDIPLHVEEEVIHEVRVGESANFWQPLAGNPSSFGAVHLGQSVALSIADREIKLEVSGLDRGRVNMVHTGSPIRVSARVDKVKAA